MCYVSQVSMQKVHAFFLKERLFSTQPQCCLTFSWIELQMLRRCCLLHVSIIILRQFLYLVYLRPCLGLALSRSYLCNLFFFVCFHFPDSNSYNLIKTDTLFLQIFYMSYYFWMITWIKKPSNFPIAKVQPQGVP